MIKKVLEYFETIYSRFIPLEEQARKAGVTIGNNNMVSSRFWEFAEPVLSDTAVFQYKCDEFYHPEADGGISILDDSLGIDWKIKNKAILSEKDTKLPLLKDIDSPFDFK